MQPKKQLILLILNELTVNSSESEPLTQTQIAENISGKQFTCDRKTVCRNIKFLQDMGYPIKKSARGFYFEREISAEDIVFVKEAILCANGRKKEEKEALALKVARILTKQYRR